MWCTSKEQQQIDMIVHRCLLLPCFDVTFDLCGNVVTGYCAKQRVRCCLKKRIINTCVACAGYLSCPMKMVMAAHILCCPPPPCPAPFADWFAMKAAVQHIVGLSCSYWHSICALLMKAALQQPGWLIWLCWGFCLGW
jgi:hypothetical protein